MLLNTILASLSAVGQMNEATELLNEMKGRGFVPNANTYDILVSGHGKIGNKKESIKLYCEMITKGFVPRTSTFNVLIFDFAKVGKMRQAQELMHEMQVRGVIPNSSTYDILIVGWCKLSKSVELERSLKLSCRGEVRKLLEEMKDKGFTPKETTLCYISPAFSKSGENNDTEWWLSRWHKTKQS